MITGYLTVDNHTTTKEKCGAAEGRATDSPAPSFLAGSYNYGFFCPTPEISAAPTTISADGL